MAPVHEGQSSKDRASFAIPVAQRPLDGGDFGVQRTLKGVGESLFEWAKAPKVPAMRSIVGMAPGGVAAPSGAAGLKDSNQA
jgi:hypothetical protein